MPPNVDFNNLFANAHGMSGAPNPPPPAASLRRRWAAISADGWVRITSNPSAMIVAATAAQNVLRLISNIVLARLLAPNVFALVSITTLVLVSVHMISDVGIAITALREGEMTQDDEDRLWTMQTLRGFGTALIVAASAVPIGWIYSDVRLRDALLVLALSPILDGVKSLYPVLALAHRRLLPSTIIELGGRIVSIVTSVLVALISPTLWSLVIATLVSMVFSTSASYVAAGRLPRFKFDRAYIARQWRFARWIQTSSSLNFIGAQIDKAGFPFLFGMSALGIYGIGATLAALPSQITGRWSSNIFYPLAVELLRGDESARSRLIAMRTTMLLYTIIATLAIMAASPPFFMILYEPRYHAAAAIAVVLGAGAFFEIGESSLRHLPVVEGRPQFEVWTVFVRLAVFVCGVGIVMLTGSGVMGYALSYVCGLAASHLFMLTVCVRRGYLHAMTDVVLVALLAILGVIIYLIPYEGSTKIELLTQAMLTALISITAMGIVYRTRGLPSMSATPTRQTLRAAAIAEEDLALEEPIALNISVK